MFSNLKREMSWMQIGTMCLFYVMVLYVIADYTTQKQEQHKREIYRHSLVYVACHDDKPIS